MARMPNRGASNLLRRRAGFQSALAGWYRREARDLPWRKAPSLYKTVVSEFMLQQTQVKTVLPYFSRWMAALPDFATLAAEPEARVMKLWEGLGYYSRARNLRRVAQALVAMPRPPVTAEQWQELPGIGPYTAAAIASMAFGEPAACVDGNVVRILARLTADGRNFGDGAAAAKAFAPIAQALIPSEAPGDHNQAMMELGAVVCLRQHPACDRCPVRTCCAAAKDARPARYPRLARRRIESQSVTRVWCVRGNELLLSRARAGARRLADLHELPTPEEAGLAEKAVVRGRLLAKKRRSITRFRIVESIFAARPPRKSSPGLVWAPVARLDSLVLSGPHRRWIAEILGGRGRC